MTLRRETHLPYMPAIDALRALAVLAVFFYHVGAEWMPGGFLGVDVFFVISGYLITALLLSEFERNGYIDVLAFWLRRARRLLPAVAVMIALTLIVALIVIPDEARSLRNDAVTSLLYVNNWDAIVSDQSYFESFARPSLFQHLWSLSVEEQFYLLWPLVCAAGLTLLGRRRLLVVALVGAAGSAALMSILYDASAADGARAFLGTDTRASALLIGVALAIVWHPAELPELGARGRLALDVAGSVGLAMVLWSLLTVDDFDPSVYDGGFLLLAVWTGLLVGTLAHPASRLATLVASAPAVWLGVRSYGFYLWHWPVIALTRPGIDVSLEGPLLVILQLLVTIGLADLSYRFIEQPFRRRGGSPAAPGWLRVGRPALAVAVVATVVAVGWTGLSPEGGSEVAAANEAEVAEVPVTPPDDDVSTVIKGRDVLAIGDSVMAAAEPALQAQLGRGAVIDADEARQPSEYPSLLSVYRDAGDLRDHVVIQIGNNGPVYDEDIAALREVLAGVPNVYLINVEVPRSWEDEVNDELAAAVEDWPEATLIDWNGALADRGRELTYDGIHPNPEGDALYTALLVEAMAAEG